MMVFFVPGLANCGMNAITRALKARDPYADISGMDTVCVVATSWPVGHIADFLNFCQRPIWDRQTADDTVVSHFVKIHRITVLATAPSLVEHPDMEPSLIRDQHFAGRSAIRKAAYFVD